MRAGSLIIIAEIIGREYYDCNLFMEYIPSLKRKKHFKDSKIGYSRTWDRRTEIYESKRRNTTRK